MKQKPSPPPHLFLAPPSLMLLAMPRLHQRPSSSSTTNHSPTVMDAQTRIDNIQIYDDP